MSDLPLDSLIDDFRRKKVVASFASVNSAQTFHTIRSTENGMMMGMSALNERGVWINGGFFVLRREIFEHIREGEQLVEQPFARLLEKKQLATYLHRGLWHTMDTFRARTFQSQEARRQY